MKWKLKGKKKYSLIRFFKGFGYAFNGIISALKTEQNLLIELILGMIFVGLGLYFKISNLELCIIIVCIGILLSLELINTAIENIVDMTMPQVHPLAKLAKDTGAGAILIFSIITIIVVLIIMIPRIF